jgi:hypothetical protein
VRRLVQADHGWLWPVPAVKENLLRLGDQGGQRLLRTAAE